MGVIAATVAASIGAVAYAGVTGERWPLYAAIGLQLVMALRSGGRRG